MGSKLFLKYEAERERERQVRNISRRQKRMKTVKWETIWFQEKKAVTSLTGLEFSAAPISDVHLKKVLD
jgi:hypothetical protein